MPWDIKELTYLLVVGLFFIGMTELFVWFTFGYSYFNYNRMKSRFAKTALLGLALAIALSTGLFFDALSKRWVGKPSIAANEPVGWALQQASRALPRWIALPSEKSIRSGVLLDAADPSGLSDLGREILESNTLPVCAGDAGASLQELWVKSKFIPPTDTRVAPAFQRFYYFSKNRVYAKDTYFQELRGYQFRTDFVRSMHLACAVVTACGIIFLLIGVVTASGGRRAAKRVAILAALVIFSFAGTIISRESFIALESAFCNRVFGYSLSLSNAWPNSAQPASTFAPLSPPTAPPGPR